jgi:intracellular sulfur oxidation DsrE/DsrF family protein
MLMRSLLLTMMFALLSCPATIGATQTLDDSEALSGLNSAKVIFDVRIADLDKLVFNLTLFSETLEGIIGQGIKPEMIVAFRGAGVKLLSAEALNDEAIDLFRDLSRKGVRFEACGVAMRIYKVDLKQLIPEVKPVANVFNSFIGYQNKGYAMIAIN